MVTVNVVLVCVVLIPVVMHFERCAFPERQFSRSINLKKFRDGRVTGQCLDRAFQPRRQVGTDPKNQIGLLQCCRL